MAGPLQREELWLRPELIEDKRRAKDKRWDVTVAKEHSGVIVDKRNRVMVVPPAGDESDEASRILGLAAVSFTPPDDATADPLVARTTLGHVLRNLDTVRLHGILKRRGIDTSNRLDHLMWEEAVVPVDKRERTLFALNIAYEATSGHNGPLAAKYNEAVGGLPDEIRDLIHTSIDVLAAAEENESYLAFRDQQAAAIAKLIEPPPPPMPRPRTRPEDEEVKRQREQMEQIRSQVESSRVLPSMEEGDAPAPSEEGDQTSYDGKADQVMQRLQNQAQAAAVGGTNRIGKMYLHDHITPAKRTRQVRLPRGSTASGEVPTRWHRLPEDQAVFTSRRPGGSVLLDCSGSMSWDYDELRRAVQRLPSATIGLYSGGAPNLSAKGYNGALCIIARNGRWSDDVKDSYNEGGGNEVDLEALLWLTTQREPRLWLSDGEVCGGDYVARFGDGALKKQVRAVCKEFHIQRIREVPDAIKVMDQRRRPADVENPAAI